MIIMKENDEKWLLIGISFTILFLMCVYKLTNASLWFDETIEFYYSKTFLGELPWDAAVDSMYKRIVSTYQPPLYNFVMYFWLKISESEWWFRFFGVVMGFIGGIGVFKSVEKLWNYRAAAVSVIVLACTKQYIYYTQECAEYTILLAGVSWLMYTWICLMEEVTPKRVMRFLLAAIISVYSQYGAVFPVAAFATVALANTFWKKSKKAIMQILVGYGTAAVFAALPLWVFFLSKQMKFQQASTAHVFSVTNGRWKDAYMGLKTVIGWCFTYNAAGFIITAAILLLFVLIFSKKKTMQFLVVANAVCWIVYYIAVKLSFYSYGSFGSRYNLFFIPVWLVSIFAIVGEFGTILRELLDKKSSQKIYNFLLERIKLLYIGICLSIAFVFCLTGWEVLKSNWEKEDIRGATDAWYNAKAYDSATLVYYGADSGFYYYCEHNSAFDENKLDNVMLMGWNRDKAKEEYISYLNKIYNKNWPEELYIVASHCSDDLNTLVQCFTDSGYALNEVFNNTDAKLIRLTLQK